MKASRERKKETRKQNGLLLFSHFMGTKSKQRKIILKWLWSREIKRKFMGRILTSAQIFRSLDISINSQNDIFHPTFPMLFFVTQMSLMDFSIQVCILSSSKQSGTSIWRHFCVYISVLFLSRKNLTHKSALKWKKKRGEKSITRRKSQWKIIVDTECAARIWLNNNSVMTA